LEFLCSAQNTSIKPSFSNFSRQKELAFEKVSRYFAPAKNSNSRFESSKFAKFLSSSPSINLEEV